MTKYDQAWIRRTTGPPITEEEIERVRERGDDANTRMVLGLYDLQQHGPWLLRMTCRVCGRVDETVTNSEEWAGVRADAIDGRIKSLTWASCSRTGGDHDLEPTHGMSD
mgnify:CR=1 FL=1